MVVRLWEKVHLSCTAFLHDARWEIVCQHCWEQVCRLTADLRKEAMQAHEDDRDNRMTTWKIGFARITRPHANGASVVDNEKLVMVQREHGTHTHHTKHPTLRKCTHSWRKLGYLSSSCPSWARSQPWSSLKFLPESISPECIYQRADCDKTCV